MSSAGAAGAIVDGVRIGPPPDLPSMLLHDRIVYLGMPLASSVTELIVAELLFLNFDSNTDPIFMYINSAGTSSMPRQISGFETEAFAILDTMDYIGPECNTICLGTAFGTAAMLLANGKKGSRACLPNSIMMLHQPRSMARGQASDIRIKAREVLQNREAINTILAEKTGQTVEKVTQDSSRTMYLDANQALEYGLIDKVLRNEDDLPAKPAFLSSL
jgi:ATP-dependent Clp protease protease subunit